MIFPVGKTKEGIIMELKKVSLEDLIKAAKEAQAKAESEADSKQNKKRTR